MSRVGSRRTAKLRGVAVEVALEHRADPADRAVALRGVEQLVDHPTERASVPEEPLERSWQAAVAVGEVRPQGLLERLGRLVVDRLGLTEQLLELAADEVDIDAHGRVLERDEPDPEGPADQLGPVVGRPLGKEAREGGVVDDEPVDVDPVAVDPDPGAGRGGVGAVDDGQWWERFGGHAPTVPGARDSLRVTAESTGQLPRYVVRANGLRRSGTW